MASVAELRSHKNGEDIVTTGKLIIDDKYATGGLGFSVFISDIPKIENKVLDVSVGRSGDISAQYNHANGKLLLFEDKAGVPTEVANSDDVDVTLPFTIRTR